MSSSIPQNQNDFTGHGQPGRAATRYIKTTPVGYKPRTATRADIEQYKSGNPPPPGYRTPGGGIRTGAAESGDPYANRGRRR
jgi:hypothetical protein